MRKRGSAGEWAGVILVILIVGFISVFVSTSMTYSKTDIDQKISGLKNEIIAEDYSSCESIQLTEGTRSGSYKPQYYGKSPREICEEKNKKIIALTQEYTYTTFYGLAAENCDTYQTDGFAFDQQVYDFTSEEEYDKKLIDEQAGNCRPSGAKTSISNERTIYSQLVCC